MEGRKEEEETLGTKTREGQPLRVSFSPFSNVSLPLFSSGVEKRPNVTVEAAEQEREGKERGTRGVFQNRGKNDYARMEREKSCLVFSSSPLFLLPLPLLSPALSSSGPD